MRQNPIIPKVWITKYAMSANVFTRTDAEHCVDISQNMISVKKPGKMTEAYHGNDWSDNRSDAVKHVAELKKSKIESLKKSLAKIEAIDPEKVVPE